MAPSRGRIAILCGPGGNGGDGFIAARLLNPGAIGSSSALLGDRARMRGDPALAAERWRGAGSRRRRIRVRRRRPRHRRACTAPACRATSTARRSACVEAINAVARSGRPVLSVDAPSGVDGATGQGARRGGRGERQRHVLSPQAGAPAAARTRSVRPSRARRHRPQRGRARRDRAQGLRQRAGDLARRLAAARRLRPQIYARRGAHRLRPRPSHRRGAAGGARGAARRRRAWRPSPARPTPSRPIPAISTAVMVAPFAGLAGFARAARRPATQRRADRAGRRRRRGDARPRRRRSDRAERRSRARSSSTPTR